MRDNMDETRGHYAKQNKKEKLHDLIHRWNFKKLQKQRVEWWLPEVGNWGKKGDVGQG